ncbi:chitobiase/beta-hexosaminidase C-terminal domain-containing protein [Terracidiphilus gabretensis]|uniref:chitobiase/beta-hexosaminidase C-terminal domain-containing protein n=1 Tax=Terracidiphilus gabretensis TaxID=1577687 RepID=UPI00071C142A|nr:chitobiase/beta-hexosaminidase C-terminal domain-containing protein [Terracidiphilus gabretensis]
MIDRLYRFRILREEPSKLIAAMDEANGAQVWLAPIQFDPSRRATQTKALLAVAETLKAEKFTANGRFYLVASSEAAARDLLSAALESLSAKPANPTAVFLDALKRCKAAGLVLPEQVNIWAKELEDAAQIRSRRLSELFNENSAHILEALIQVADNRFDKNRQNSSLQSALKEMVSLAGLKFIEPKEGARLDDLRHTSLRSIHEAGREDGTIASVTIRGLMRPPSTIILKAHVNHFGGTNEKKNAGNKSWLKVFVGAAVAAILVVTVIAVWPSKTATPQIQQNNTAWGHVIQFSDATGGATIYYTTDGSTPTTSSLRYDNYNGVGGLSGGTTVRAIAKASGHTTSNVAERTVYISDAEGSFNRGKYFYDHRRYMQAREPLKAACDGNFSLACNYLGAMYAEGQGLFGANNAAAHVYFQKACDAGIATGCTNLGAIYERVGMTSEARDSYKRACDSGNDKGCNALRRLP